MRGAAAGAHLPGEAHAAVVQPEVPGPVLGPPRVLPVLRRSAAKPPSDAGVHTCPRLGIRPGLLPLGLSLLATGANPNCAVCQELYGDESYRTSAETPLDETGWAWFMARAASPEHFRDRRHIVLKGKGGPRDIIKGAAAENSLLTAVHVSTRAVWWRVPAWKRRSSSTWSPRLSPSRVSSSARPSAVAPPPCPPPRPPSAAAGCAI